MILLRNIEQDIAFEYAKNHISTATEPAGYYFGAHDDNSALIGIVGMRMRWRFVGEVCHLYVAYAHRGKGIGSTLLKQLLFAVQGKQFYATTLTSNEKAIRLFMRNGWSVLTKEQSKYSERMVYVFGCNKWRDECDEAE